jgi:hypothetical protein
VFCMIMNAKNHGSIMAFIISIDDISAFCLFCCTYPPCSLYTSNFTTLVTMYSLSRCTYIECIEYHGPTMNIVPWHLCICRMHGEYRTVHKTKLFFVMLITSLFYYVRTSPSIVTTTRKSKRHSRQTCRGGLSPT